jgi:hypothetical protein
MATLRNEDASLHFQTATAMAFGATEPHWDQFWITGGGCDKVFQASATWHHGVLKNPLVKCSDAIDNAVMTLPD